MCGISAILAFDDGTRRTASADLLRMHAVAGHRGPDGEGFLTVGCDFTVRRAEPPTAAPATPARVALGFRWLVVQDAAAAAAQPMGSADGGKWLVFNGEIYNYLELRDELRAAGREFHTESDAEVILAAYDAWGTDCFRRFNGMWALVLADVPARRVIVSRDRFGIRPLFWVRRGTGFAFASEAKQLLEILPSVRMNERYVTRYLDRGSLHHRDQETFFEGVHTVPPASFAVIGMDGPAAALRFETYWDAADFSSQGAAGRESRADEFGALLSDAVAKTLRTPAVTVSFLSGGLDSSVATALMREVRPEAAHFETCSIVFPENPGADESRFIDDFVSMHHCRSARATIDARYVRENLDAVTWTHEEPLVASAQIAQYRAFQLVRERGARVVIDGQGSDEVLAGYPEHEIQAWQERMARGRWGSGLREGRILARKFGVRALLVAAARRSGIRRSRYDFLRVASPNVRLEPPPTGDPSWIARQTVDDLKSMRLRPILLNGDRNGMAHSIESRLPYLDHRVVEFALKTPAAMKVGFGERKRLLREVARGRVPQSYLDRRDKMGFITPEPDWLRGELAADVRAAVGDPKLRDVPLVDRRRAAAFVEKFFDGSHRDFRAVWRLYAFRRWLAVYRLL